ncbi:MAG: phage tail protein, partial [bacterium]|nr:phage tail protein [bacterium]
MGRFDGVILTSKGLRLQAKAQTGIPLVIKSVVVGDGYLPEGTDVIQMTSLINQIADAHTDIISNEVKSDGFTYLEARISSGEAAFFLREIGIIATDPDEGDILYAYANADDYADFIPASDESVTIQDITLVTAVGNAENIEVNVSISAGISRNDFENLKAQLTELKETVESKPHVAVVYRN